MATARELVGLLLNEDHPGDHLAQLGRVRSLDAAVRRALRTMARRGLVVPLGRWAKARRASLAVYATLDGARTWAEMAEQAKSFFDKQRLAS
jgi:hypothetical protein